jgi:hypothetical protein
MKLKFEKTMTCLLDAKGKRGNAAAAWMGLSFFLRMVYYFGFVNFNDLPAMELVFSVVLALLVSVTFILMLKLGRLGIPLLGAGLCLAYAVLYFFAETMNVPGILSGICVLALAVLILLAVLGYVPEQKLLLRAGMVALAVRVLLVDLIGYILPLAQWNIIGWVPKASNLFAVVAMVSLCAALKLEKAE